jgi:hypothetical protein
MHASIRRKSTPALKNRAGLGAIIVRILHRKSRFPLPCRRFPVINRRVKIFPRIAALCFLFLAGEATAATAHISWTYKPGEGNYVNDQTKLAFRASVGGFRLNEKNLAREDGGASFTYRGKYGIISVWFTHRGILGCGKGVDCAGGQVDAYRVEMKRLHGKYDLERSFGLQRSGSRRGRGTMFHFLASPLFRMPVYSEVGAFEVGEFVYCYRATFMDKAGLNDLAAFLRAFGVKKV